MYNSHQLVNWLEVQVICLDFWDNFGRGTHSSFLSRFLRYRVWGCSHSSISFVGHQDRQSPSLEGGLLSAEPPQSHESHRHSFRVCCCHIFSGKSNLFTDVIAFLVKRMLFERMASSKSAFQEPVCPSLKVENTSYEVEKRDVWGRDKFYCWFVNSLLLLFLLSAIFDTKFLLQWFHF